MSVVPRGARYLMRSVLLPFMVGVGREGCQAKDWGGRPISRQWRWEGRKSPLARGTLIGRRAAEVSAHLGTAPWPRPQLALPGPFRRQSITLPADECRRARSSERGTVTIRNHPAAVSLCPLVARNAELRALLQLWRSSR